MSEVAMRIALTEASLAIGDLPEGTSLPDRFTAAARQTYRHWMATDEDDQFRAAISAVMLSAEPDERESLAAEVRALSAIAAALSGVPVDFDALPVAPENPVGLLNLWNAVKDAK